MWTCASPFGFKSVRKNTAFSRNVDLCPACLFERRGFEIEARKAKFERMFHEIDDPRIFHTINSNNVIATNVEDFHD